MSESVPQEPATSGEATNANINTNTNTNTNVNVNVNVNVNTSTATPPPPAAAGAAPTTNNPTPNTNTNNDIDSMTSTMFQNIAAYIKGELTATTADYGVLAALNRAAGAKYQEMDDLARGLAEFMKDLQAKYQDFRPYLEKIDEIDTNVSELEKTVQLLDEYSKRLEWKFKNLDKATAQQTKE